MRARRLFVGLGGLAGFAACCLGVAVIDHRLLDGFTGANSLYTGSMLVVTGIAVLASAGIYRMALDDPDVIARVFPRQAPGRQVDVRDQVVPGHTTAVATDERVTAGRSVPR